MAIEIVDLPIKKMWFSIAMLVYQRVSHSSLLLWDYPMIINHHGKLAAGFAS